MKKNFIFLFTVFALSFSIKAQAQGNEIPMNDIFTPFCNPVHSLIVEEMSPGNRMFYDSLYAVKYPDAKQIITFDGYSSSYRFNCHGYAWLKYLNDAVVRWIGYYFAEVGMYPDIYLYDGSYSEVTGQVHVGDIAFWDFQGPQSGVARVGDHSGVYIGNGKVRSKWYIWPLMEHSPDYGPATPTSWDNYTYKYYRKTDVGIIGSGQVCASGTTFNLSHTPNCTIQWSVPSPFYIVSPSSSAQVIIGYTGTSMKSDYLTATFNGTTIKKNITTAPVITADNGDKAVSYAGESFTLSCHNSGTVTWTVTGPFMIKSNSGNKVTVCRTGSNTGSGTLKALVNGAEQASKSLTACSPATISGVDYEFVCSTTNFTVSGGTVSNWSISQTNPFYLSSNSNTATITVQASTTYSLATITAVIDGGGSVSKNIQTCYIFGSSTVCHSSSYQLSTGEIPVWSLTNMNPSNCFTLSTSNGGLTATVASVSPAGQTATLQASVNGRTHTLNVQACAASVNGPDTVCGTATYTLNMGPYATSWTTGGDGIKILSSNASSATIEVDPAYGQQVAVIALMSVGGVAKNFIASCGKGAENIPSRYVSVYPNPANNILTVEIDEEAAALIRENRLGSQSNKITPTYDIRLHNIMGVIVRSEKTKDTKVEFDVSNLPNGFYFLYVYDGIIPTPEFHTVVVSH